MVPPLIWGARFNKSEGKGGIAYPLVTRGHWTSGHRPGEVDRERAPAAVVDSSVRAVIGGIHPTRVMTSVGLIPGR